MTVPFTANCYFAFGVDPIQDGLGVIGPAWAANDQVGRLQRVTIDRGHQNRWDPFQPGTMTLTFDETDFGFDPVVKPELVPMVPVLFTLTKSTLSNMFVGFVQPRDGYSWHFDSNTGTTTVRCYDLLGWLSTRKINTGGVTYDNIRNTDLLQQVEVDITNYRQTGLPGPDQIWPTYGNDFSTEDVGLTLLGGYFSPDGMDVLSFAQKVQQSEGGAFYIRSDGTIACDSRAAWFQQTRQNTSQATFDLSRGTLGPSADFRAGWDMSYAQTYTSCNVSTAANPDVVWNWTEGNTTFGIQEFPDITGAYFTGAAEALACAQRIVKTSQPFYYPSKITVQPRRNTALMETVKALDLRDQVTVIAPDFSGVNTYSCHVESIHHDIDFQNNSWTATFGFSSRDQLLLAQPAAA